MLQDAILALFDQLPEARLTLSKDGDTITLVASMMWDERPLATLHRVAVNEISGAAVDASRGEAIGRELAAALERAKTRRSR